MVVALLASVALLQAPLPTALMEAQTVYLVNTSGERKWLDLLADELTKWERFEVIADRKAADLIVTLSFGPMGDGITAPMAGSYFTFEDEAFGITLQGRESDEVVWQDQEGDTFTKKGAVEKLVRKLRRRIEKEEKPES